MRWIASAMFRRTHGQLLKPRGGNMQELILNPNRNHEPKPGDLERRLAQKQAKLPPEEALQKIASAYKEGLQTGGKAEAERRMRVKLNEIAPD
jgi:hypothetical protein